jgi:Transglutaminase-like superfamily
MVAPPRAIRRSGTKWVPHPRIAGEEILAAARWTAALPWGVPDCLPRALAIRALMRRLGYPAELVFGASILAFAPHVWVTVDCYRVDSGRSDQSLEVFRAIA